MLICLTLNILVLRFSKLGFNFSEFHLVCTVTSPLRSLKENVRFRTRLPGVGWSSSLALWPARAAWPTLSAISSLRGALRPLCRCIWKTSFQYKAPSPEKSGTVGSKHLILTLDHAKLVPANLSQNMRPLQPIPRSWNFTETWYIARGQLRLRYGICRFLPLSQFIKLCRRDSPSPLHLQG